MKLLFKQRLLSWFDTYDIFDEAGEVLFTVKGEFSVGHRLRVYDKNGESIGHIQQKFFSLLPKFEIFKGEEYIGSIRKEFTFFMPKFFIDFCGWSVEGNCFEWDYSITNALGENVATVSKQLWNWTDTYIIEVANEKDSLYALMLVLAIDAEKCSRKD